MSSEAVWNASEDAAGPKYALGALCRYAFKLGTIGFGPVALVGYMHRDLVERRG